jgi:hypothetical protein
MEQHWWVPASMAVAAVRSQRASLQETDDLPGAKWFVGCFLSGTRQRHYLPSARPHGTRQRNAPGKPTFAECRTLGKVHPSAKIVLCRVPGTRQSKAVGKGGRRDHLHLPSSFAECHAVRHSAKHFLFFFKFLCRVPPNLAPSKDFFIFF